MSRLIFFIREAFRALRRNGAPSMAAIVTTVVTVVLLGVLIPIFQTTQAKSDPVRASLEFRVPVYDDATQAEIAALETKLRSDPARRVGRASSPRARRSKNCKETSARRKAHELLTSSTHNPLPANFPVKPDDAANLDRHRTAVIPPGPDGKPQPISPIIQPKRLRPPGRRRSRSSR